MLKTIFFVALLATAAWGEAGKCNHHATTWLKIKAFLGGLADNKFMTAMATTDAVTTLTTDQQAEDGFKDIAAWFKGDPWAFKGCFKEAAIATALKAVFNAYKKKIMALASPMRRALAVLPDMIGKCGKKTDSITLKSVRTWAKTYKAESGDSG